MRHCGSKPARYSWQCIAPKTQHKSDITPKLQHNNDQTITARGHRSIYIDSDAGGKRRLGVLRHEDREVFAWVRFFAWISKCPSGHLYYWLLDWITLLVKFSENIRFSWWMFLGKAKQLQRSFANSESPNDIKHCSALAPLCKSLCWGSRRIVIYNQLGCRWS